MPAYEKKFVKFPFTHIFNFVGFAKKHRLNKNETFAKKLKAQIFANELKLAKFSQTQAYYPCQWGLKKGTNYSHMRGTYDLLCFATG